MKRKLLFTIAALLCSAGVWAQAWTADAIAEGSFYLYNVGGAKFLTGGNAWGTHASLDDYGLYCTLTASDGAYTINTGNGKYLGSDGYVDNGTPAKWTFAAVADQTNTYTIYNSDFGGYLVATNGSTDLSVSSSVPSDNFGYWKLASREAMLNAIDLRAADADRPVDMTFLMSGVNFVRNCDGWENNPGAKSGSVTGGWSYSTGDNNFVFCGPEGSSQANTGCEMWNNTFDVYQTVTLPNGKYYVTCDGFGSTNTRIYAGVVETAFTKTGVVNGHDFSQVLLNIGSYKEGGKSGIVTVTNGSLKVGVKRSTNAGSEWTVIDNFRLYSIGNSLSVIDPSAFISGSSASADTWYTLNVPSDGWYTVSSTAGTIYYTQDGTLPIDFNYFPHFSTSTTKYLKAGAFFFKASTSSTVTIESTSVSVNGDFTSFISNPSFEEGDMSGWVTICGDKMVDPNKLSDCGVKAVGNGYPLSNSDGDYIMNYYGWAWSDSPLNGIQQTIYLPAGNYRVQAVLGGWTNWKMVLDVNGSPQEETMTADNEGVSFSKDITLASNSDLTITAKTYHYGSNAWEACFIKADNFRLYNLDHYYDELNAAITAAESHTLGFEVGEYAPYNNVAAIDALDAAKAVNQNNYDISWSELQTIVSTLTSATWTPNATEENAFYDGDFSECAEDNTSPLDYTPAGWTASNNMRMMLKNSETYPGLTDASATSAMMSWSAGINYGETTGYTMPLNAYTIYELKFKAAGWNNESRSGMTVSVLNSSDGLAATDLGTPDRDIKGNANNTAGMTSYTKRFKTGAAGNYVFHIQSGNNFVLTDLELKKAATTAIDTDENYTPEAGLANVEMTRTIKVGYNTVCLPFDVTAAQVTAAFGADSEVYNYSGDSQSEGSINLTFTRNNERTISANVPVLVKVIEGQESSTQTFNGVEIEVPGVGGATDFGTNVDYVGVYTNTTMVAGDFFLATKNDIQQIFKSNGTDTVKPFRAYFKVNEDPGETGGDVKLFIDDEATGIDSLTPDPSPVGEGSIYNLAGQRLNKMQKGINIVNGKKILY